MQSRTIKETTIQSNHGIYISRRASEYLLSKINSGNHEFLVPSYIAALCAGIEGDINTAFIDYFHHKIKINYMPYVRSYIFMRIDERFAQLPLLLSESRFRLNHDNEAVKNALALFELRNSLMHVKHLWHPAKIEVDAEGNWWGIDYIDLNHPDPYRGDKELDKRYDLNSFMKTYNTLIPFFHGIASKIKRKNFNPKAIFIRT